MRAAAPSYLAAAMMVSVSPPVSHQAHAQIGVQPNAAQIQKRLARLSVLGSVLYVAAHPDDENTSLLTYLANGRQVRAVYLSMTRGDGGQNLIGAEQGEDLGLIRTQELLAARRIDGAEQLFTRARDFGYSKSVDEALRLWGEEEILSDVVLAIRRVRPDVIITRFSPEGGGHGHHTASARLAVKAFRLAGDPKYQVKAGPKLPPWQPRRIFRNQGSWEGPPKGGPPRVDVGLYDPLLGASYGELSAESRSMHKSQGFGATRRRGQDWEYLEPLDEAPGAAKRPAGSTDPFAGIDWSWKRVPGSETVAKLAAEAARKFQPRRPSEIVPTLVALDAALEKLSDVTWREQKRAEVAELVAACTGLWLDGEAATELAVPGTALAVEVTALNRATDDLELVDLRFVGPALAGGAGKPLSVNQKLVVHKDYSRKIEVPIAKDAVPSAPYWLRKAGSPARYEVADAALIGLPENPPPLSLRGTIKTAGRRFVLERPVTYRWTDPVEGERRRLIGVVPAVWVQPESEVLLFPDRKGQSLRVRVKAAAPKQEGTLTLDVPPGFAVAPASARFSLPGAGDEAVLAFSVRPGGGAGAGKASKGERDGGADDGAGSGLLLRPVAKVGEATFTERVDVIQHDHIPAQRKIGPATVRLVPVDLRRGGARIGYIPGAGDEVVASLERVGYAVTILDEAALTSTPLAGFDAIVTGVRAFNTNDRLRFHHRRLMDYVKAGGTMVVQYNTANRRASVADALGPSPFDLSRGRVTDENAAVTFALPKHPILNTPNRITAADFEGWVQERGLYFASTWDKSFEAPLAMADPGEDAQKGALIVTRHGRGAFIYTGLAFFRQLPAGVPGAYRLFSNLLAHGRAPKR